MATVAYWLGHSYEGQLGLDVDEDALVTLFTIFASSMLTVATFTVSAIVAAAATAAGSTTPRATRLVVSDRTAQTVLAAFISAFIYSFIAIIALKVVNYGPFGRFLLFAGLVGMVAFVLWSFISWIDHAMKVGRQSNTIAKLVSVAHDALTPNAVGTFGASEWSGAVPANALAITCKDVGYVSEIDVAGLQALASERAAEIILTIRPGDLCEPTTPVAYVTDQAAKSMDWASAICKAIALDKSRHEDVDVRFNILNLTETADRALSPGINDPGTAIYILNELLDIFVTWSKAKSEPEASKVVHARVSMPPLRASDLVKDAMTAIARDGAGSIEVVVRLQKVLAALTRLGNAELTSAARDMSRIARDLSDKALVSDDHRRRSAELASAVQHSDSSPAPG